MNGLDDKVAIVTGASRGIGFAIAERLLAEGARVVLTARKAGELEDAVTRLAAPDRTLGIPGNASDAGHREQVVERTLERFGRIDHLVNNAGINPVYGPLVDLDLDAARKTAEVNAIAPLAWVQAIHRAWWAHHSGAVVNLCSVAGLLPGSGIGWYGATKAMLGCITQSLAVELGPGVRVNAVAPAVVKTQFAAALYDGREDEVAAPYPLGRLAVPADVAGVVAFLLSEDASWITGQVVVVDGGITLVGATE